MKALSTTSEPSRSVPAGPATSIARAARWNIDRRIRQHAVQNEQARARATEDARAIIELIAVQFSPERIYQWGSVLRQGAFREYSDIDIALEGVTDAGAFFQILKQAEALTSFPVDIVQLETIEPEFADSIRKHGVLVYERP